MLSILIPTYNTICTDLVAQIHAEAIALKIPFEILVADDGSRCEIDEANRQVTMLSNCFYFPATENIGPARLRNRLASLAKYRYILFLDTDVLPVRPTFLADYLKAAQPGSIVCGGFCYKRRKPSVEHALRYYYGINVEEKSADERNRHPYAQFISMSFLADRNVFNQVRFDEAMHIGYEDTYFGILLKQNNIPLLHIDNPVYHLTQEPSAEYLRKIRNAINVLSMNIEKQRPHVRLLQWYTKLEQYGLTRLTASIFRLTRPAVETNLMGKMPSLKLFAFYKLGYLCLIRKSIPNQT